MPLHKQVTHCLKEKNAKINDFCSCQHCTLAVCRVCGQYEGGLTQDCPGVKMSMDVGALVYEGGLDYTDERGWFVHDLKQMAADKTFKPGPRFEPTAEGIIKRLSQLKVNDSGIVDQPDYVASLKKDAEYWLNNREGRR